MLFGHNVSERKPTPDTKATKRESARPMKVASYLVPAPLASWPGPHLNVMPASRGDRQIALLLLAFAIPWLVYTRMYFWLQPRHLTIDGGLFMHLFNKPDPTCGLTRTFAWMWRGDLTHAFAVYPLGPLVVLGTILAVSWALAVLIFGRALGVRLSSLQWRVVIVTLVTALALNWAAKLIWLGM